MTDKSTQDLLDEAASCIKHNTKVAAELKSAHAKYNKELERLGLDDQKVKEILDQAPPEMVEKAQAQVKKDFEPYLKNPHSEREKHEPSRHSKAIRHDNKI